MKKQRSIIAIAALLGLVGASTPALAAGPLLSGYGGPGQGNQAILGATLLNTPRGGSSGGPPAATGGEATAAPSTSGAEAAGATEAAPRRSKGHHAAGGAAQPARPAALDPAQVYAALERRAAQSSGTLGISGEDLAFILIGLAVLAAAAVLTGRIARSGEAGARPG